MRVKLYFAGLMALTFAAAAAVCATGNVQMPNLRLGLWEWTQAGTTSGELPIPQDLAAKLTPEQRAQMEQAVKSAYNSTHTYKTCVTKEKLEKGGGFNEEKKGCSQNILSSNGNKYTFKMECTENDITLSASGEFEVIGQETVKGAGHITGSGGGRSMTSNMIMSGKWVSSDCGALK